MLVIWPRSRPCNCRQRRGSASVCRAPAWAAPPASIQSLWHETRGQLALKGFEQALVTLDDGSERLLYTSPVTAEDLADVESLRACPSIWQQYIAKHVEIRATVFGHTVLAAEIHSQQSDTSRHD